jgi:predicted transcriptional regulator
MSTNAERFLTAFAVIETRLREAASRNSTRRIAQQDQRDWNIETFRNVLAEAVDRLPAVKRYSTYLGKYAHVRNLLAHTRDRDTDHLVQPSDLVTDHIELIARQVSDPPRVSLLQAGVSWLPADGPIGKALLLMREHGYSQVPVYRDEWTFAGLLTANTVTRWMAAAVGEAGFDIDRVKIEAVLAHTENTKHVDFTGPDKTLHSVMQQFQSAGDNGRRLEALLITEGAKRHVEPTGIITVHDLGRVHQLLSE